MIICNVTSCIVMFRTRVGTILQQYNMYIVPKVLAYILRNLYNSRGF